MFKSSLRNAALISCAALAGACHKYSDGTGSPQNMFGRVATYPVCLQLHPTCDIDDETAAEIVSASEDGNTLIYSDSPRGAIGFVDITNPAAPQPLGSVVLEGEPTSVATLGNYVVVGVNTSKDFINVSGHLSVVDIATQTIVARITLSGQPDSVAVSKDYAYIAIAIENERDEDLNDGAIPQLPAGSLDVITIDGAPQDWVARSIDVTGIATIAPSDPEPEYVDINGDNLAIVSMQENNHLAIIDLSTQKVIDHFSAGSVDLVNVDTAETKPYRIELTDTLNDVPREPDGVSWIDDNHFATANEGDWNGGSRGFTIYHRDGSIVFESGSLDAIAVQHGHYPDKRSENKGNEPENVEFGRYGSTPVLFVALERSSLVLVYDVSNLASPQLIQALPTAVGPEGVLAIPQRNLVVVASEVDERESKMRSALNIYQIGGGAAYPSIISQNDQDTPIAWGALSGLATGTDGMVYAVEDSFYGKSRIFVIDPRNTPARITRTIAITDPEGYIAHSKTAGVDALVNDDQTVNLDAEGIAVDGDGGFWVVSEGKGSVGDEKRPVVHNNLLLKIRDNGEIEHATTLPQALIDNQLRFGFEGVVERDNTVYVAFQRALKGEDHPRIGIYDVASDTWGFAYYPLDKPESQYGGWVGLSDLAIQGDSLLVLERDNQGGPDAAIKRIYTLPLASVQEDVVLEKTLHRDLMADLSATNAMIFEKVEGLTTAAKGGLYIVNDNDGVDDNSGEIHLIKLQ